MSFDYSEVAKEIVEIIREFGVEMILSNDGSPEYDPVLGREIAGTGNPVSTSFFGVKVAPTEEYAKSVEDGTIQSRDMLVYMEPIATVPSLRDTVTITENGVPEVWQLVNMQKVAPADVPVLYILQVRP